jgi:Tol biopolymer transport system component
LTAGSALYSVPAEDPADARAVYVWGFLPRGQSMKLNRQTNRFEPYLDGLSADCLDYSPDGEWIAYVSYPARELWKCRRDGSDKVLLEEGLLAWMPHWSPDGKRLAFSATRKGTYGQPLRIYTIDANGGKAEPVKGVNGPGSDPNWSPDGKKLVFAPADPVPKQDQHVLIVDLETGQVHMVPGSEGLFSPRWSPDGKHLVALKSEPPHPAAIYDFETGRWASLGATPFSFPTWSKDSRYVYAQAGGSPRHHRVPFDRKPGRLCLLDSGWRGRRPRE